MSGAEVDELIPRNRSSSVVGGIWDSGQVVLSKKSLLSTPQGEEIELVAPHEKMPQTAGGRM